MPLPSLPLPGHCRLLPLAACMSVVPLYRQDGGLRPATASSAALFFDGGWRHRMHDGARPVVATPPIADHTVYGSYTVNRHSVATFVPLYCRQSVSVSVLYRLQMCLLFLL